MCRENPVMLVENCLNGHWVCVHICDWLRLFLEAESFLCSLVLAVGFFFPPSCLIWVGAHSGFFSSPPEAKQTGAGVREGSGDWVRRSWIDHHHSLSVSFFICERGQEKRSRFQIKFLKQCCSEHRCLPRRYSIFKCWKNILEQETENIF